MQKLRNQIYKIPRKDVTQPRKNLLDFLGNMDHVTLRLRLG